jgi:hypothetical protein
MGKNDHNQWCAARQKETAIALDKAKEQIHMALTPDALGMKA